MAKIQVLGRMETAVTPNLYLTVKDYSNPGPNGGLVLGKAAEDNKSFAFVSAPNFPQGQMMLVTYPRLDYKLRMSDRTTSSDGKARRIIETIKTKAGEIAQGKSIPTPSADFLWETSERDLNTVMFNGTLVLDVFYKGGKGPVEAGVEVSGYVSKHESSNQQWKFQNRAKIQVIGRMETAVTPNLYLTVKDYSSPDPLGGLVLGKTAADNQSFAFVSATNFPQGQMMIVTYPRLDYKLRMSDRTTSSDGKARHIIETIKTKAGEIVHGMPLTTPSADYLWQTEQKDSNTIVFNGDYVLDVYWPGGSSLGAGSEVSGYNHKNGDANQRWKFQNQLEA